MGCVAPACWPYRGGGSAQPWGWDLHLGRGVYPTPGGLHPEGFVQPWGVLHPGGKLGRPLPPMNRMTYKCKNITLPQTSFAGGKNWLSLSVGESLQNRRKQNGRKGQSRRRRCTFISELWHLRTFTVGYFYIMRHCVNSTIRVFIFSLVCLLKQ